MPVVNVAKQKEKDALDRLRHDWQTPISNSKLNEWGQKMYEVDSEFEFKVENPGMLFKLMFLWNYMRYPYLHIMASQRNKQIEMGRNAKLFYLDPFAGNGVVTVVDREQLRIPGSALLSILAPTQLQASRKSVNYSYHWDLLIFNDYDKRSINSLQRRVEHLAKQLKVDRFYNSQTIRYNSLDCTDPSFWRWATRQLDELKGSSGWIHGIIYIDPPSPDEMQCSLLKDILRYPSDVIMLVHSGLFAENVNKKRYDNSKLTKILGNSQEAKQLLEGKYSVEELEDRYINILTNILRETRMSGIIGERGSDVRNHVITIRLSTKRRHYHLIVAVRRTGGKRFEEWFSWVQNLAKEISGLSELNKIILDILIDKQKTLF